MDVKVLDTYVLWEIAIGNPKFIHYLEEDFVVNDLILAEFYGIFLREFGSYVCTHPSSDVSITVQLLGKISLSRGIFLNIDSVYHFSTSKILLES